MAKAPQGRLADVTGKNVTITPEEHYDSWAKTYDSDLLNEYGYCAHRIAANALATAATDTAISVMDVGCGTGLVGVELQALGFATVDGLDVSAKMLKEAEKLQIYQRLIHVDAESNDAPKVESCDAVISVGTFGMGHMGPTAMGKVSAYAKPGGLIVLFMNAEPYIDMNFQQEIDNLCNAGLWKLQAIEDHNYMDALERPGKLIIARTGNQLGSGRI